MLDEEEYAAVMHVYMKSVQAVKEYRKAHKTTLAETPLDELYQPVKEIYERITGASGFDVDEIVRRHRISRWK